MTSSLSTRKNKWAVKSVLANNSFTVHTWKNNYGSQVQLAMKLGLVSLCSPWSSNYSTRNLWEVNSADWNSWHNLDCHRTQLDAPSVVHHLWQLISFSKSIVGINTILMNKVKFCQKKPNEGVLVLLFYKLEMLSELVLQHIQKHFDKFWVWTCPHFRRHSYNKVYPWLVLNNTKTLKHL